MKAIVHDTYGDPDVLDFREIDRPVPSVDEVLVRVHAASVNPLDVHFLTGTPYLVRIVAGIRRPKRRTRGADVAGVVEAVGANVTGFAPGDRVFGAVRGSFAEFAIASPDAILHTPDALDDAEAAALPVAAVTALQGLRDHAGARPGRSVLVNGAAGGVGTYAVQIGVALGAEVTGVCSTDNVDMVRALGAARVIDYTKEDFAADGVRYDAILDNVGNRSIAECRRTLADDGVYVMVSGPKDNRWLDPFRRMIRMKLRFLVGTQRFAQFTATETADELRELVTMVEAGMLRSVIDRRYPLCDTAEAIRYVATGHARAKVVIDVVVDGAADTGHDATHAVTEVR